LSAKSQKSATKQKVFFHEFMINDIVAIENKSRQKNWFKRRPKPKLKPKREVEFINALKGAQYEKCHEQQHAQALRSLPNTL
jgi:hypothetical protein